MTARIHNRITAAVACGLLFAVGSKLPAEPPEAPAMRSVFEPSDPVTGAHLFSQGMRIRREMPQEPVALVQPTKVELVGSLYDPVSESPFRLASLPQKAETKETQLRPAEVQQVARPELAPTKTAPAKAAPPKTETKLAELPQRQSGPTVALQRAEVTRAERPEFVAGEIHLASLPSRFPEPATALNPTAVFAAEGVDLPPVEASLPQAAPEFRLASLQPRYGEPAAPLHSAEVLPIPSNPTAPYVPALDLDRPIGALTTNIAQTSGKLPADLARERFQGEYPAWLPRQWNEVTYFWDAPDLCYGPLRYEEVNLERFGYTHCPIVQPAISGAHFFCATLALPYTMTMRPHGECIYPLGHYRPGSPVPYRPIWPEFRPLAASAEVGTIAGLILLIP